eukprot:PITA_36665
MMELTKVHWVVTKHVLRYLRGTADYGLWYIQVDGVRLEGFTDSDWAGCSIDRKSTSGRIFNIGSTSVSWFWKEAKGMEPIVIDCDNHSYIKPSTNLVFHDHSKHTEIEYHHLRDCLQKVIVKPPYIPTEERTTNILTKALARCSFVYFKDKLGVVHNPFLAKREC